MTHDTATTGKRRVAFAAYADAERLPALRRLLRGLALSHPAVCEDFLLLHPGLPEGDLATVRPLHPRLVAREAAAEVADDPAGYAEHAERAGYGTAIALRPGTAVRGDLGALLRRRERWIEPPADPEPAGVAAGDASEPGDAEPADRDFYAAYCALPGAKHPDLLLHCALPLLTGPGGRGGRAAPRVDVPALARAAAGALHRQGRYQEAVDVLTPVAGVAGRSRIQEALGSALLAVSRYPEAATHLRLATADPAVAPRAYLQLARLHWLLGEDEAAHRYAAQGLDAEPTDRDCRTLYLRTRDADGAPGATGATGAAGATGDEPAPAGEQVAHVALFAQGQENSGDKVLPEAVRRCLGPEIGPRRWHPVHVHRLVTDEVLAELNARRGVVVGGGGLFLPDTWPNGNSGWQWNVSDEALERITVPLAVFAVGFNLFDGQSFGRARMSGSLRALAERAAFFGLRNRGSVARVRELLPAELGEKVRFQPCPTTVLRHLVPGWMDPEPAERADVTLLNCAFDRAGLRFGHDYGHFLGQLAEAVQRLGTHTEVRYAAHAPSDEKFVHDLRREHGLTLPVDPLYDLDNEELLAAYRRVRLVVGMRGHASMVPFGCGTPVLSLVSHPKMAYFLADIERPEWGVSVHAPDLADRLVERVVPLLTDHAAAVADVHDRQRELWRVTEENGAELNRLFGLAPAAP